MSSNVTDSVSAAFPATGIPASTKLKNFFLKSSLISKIKGVAKFVFKSLVCLAFFQINPSLFAAGFIVGIVLNTQIELTAQKVKSIWNRQPWTSCLLIMFGGLISMPVVAAAGTIFCGANLGSSLARDPI